MGITNPWLSWLRAMCPHWWRPVRGDAQVMRADGSKQKLYTCVWCLELGAPIDEEERWK